MIKAIDYAEVQKLALSAKDEDPNKLHLWEGKIPINWYGLFENESLIGCMGLLIRGKSANFRGWYVKKEYRHYGYGAKLLIFAELETKRLGLNKLVINTWKNLIGYKVTKEFKSWGGKQYVRDF